LALDFARLKNFVMHPFSSSLGIWLMREEMKQQFGGFLGNMRSLIVSDYKPILICPGVKAAKDFAPGKLPLAGKF
jgi:hypothetical protein